MSHKTPACTCSFAAARRFLGTGHDIYFDVPLADLTRTDGGGIDDSLRLSCLICREGTVIAAARPFRLNQNGRQSNLKNEEERELRARIPDFPLVFSQPKDSDQDMAKRLEERSREFRAGARSGGRWFYEFQPLTQEEHRLLSARKMVEMGRRVCWGGVQKSRSPESPDFWEDKFYIPTLYGRLQGLAEGYAASFESQDLAPLLTPTVGCARRMREKLQAPWEEPRLWERVPFEQRLERLRNGQPCNIGHCLAAARRIADSPVSAYISHMKSRVERQGEPCAIEMQLRDNLGDLFMTYGQAAVKIDQMLRNEHTRERGLDMLWELALCQSLEYKLKKGKKE